MSRTIFNAFKDEYFPDTMAGLVHSPLLYALSFKIKMMMLPKHRISSPHTISFTVIDDGVVCYRTVYNNPHIGVIQVELASDAEFGVNNPSTINNTGFSYEKYGIYHRENGPAQVSHGKYRNSISYYNNGKLHRIDGPARCSLYGSKYWFINGKNITVEIEKWAEDMSIDLDNLSEDDKVMIQLYWDN